MKLTPVSLFVFLLLFSLVVSCKKEKLPKPTQEGKNTFGCKVNGKVFLPKGGGLFGTFPILVDNFPMSGFLVRGRRNNGEHGYNYNVVIYLPYLTKTGTYHLGTQGTGEYSVEVAGGATYRTNRTHTGEVNITRCDLINRIYSGTFSFTAVDENTGEVVKVTDGRFDVQDK